MAVESARVKVGDRVFRLTTDGNRYSPKPATVVQIAPDAGGSLCTIALSEDPEEPPLAKRGRMNKDGSATITQARLARGDRS